MIMQYVYHEHHADADQFTIWFPIRLRKIIRQALPSVDKYTELGSLRSKSEMDREYQRLLDRDKQPLAFLYKGMDEID